MIDLTKYVYKHNLTIVCTDDTIINGNAICMSFSDESASGEDEIDIETANGKIYAIKQSEIKLIKE